MFVKVTFIVWITVLVSLINCKPYRQSKSERNLVRKPVKFDDYLSALAAQKRLLQDQGYYPKYFADDDGGVYQSKVRQTRPTSDHRQPKIDVVDSQINRAQLKESASEAFNQRKSNEFNELEILQLIPVIIEQLKLGHVSEGEQETLAIIFGSLWDVIKEESLRSPDTAMNPVLEALLQTKEIRLAKREVNFHKITRHSIRLPPLSAASAASTNQDTSPAQRILQKAAVIIHKYYLEKASKKKLKLKSMKRKSLRRHQKNKARKQISVVQYQRNKRHLSQQSFLDIETMTQLLALMSARSAEAKSSASEEQDNAVAAASVGAEDDLNNEGDYYDDGTESFARDEAFDNEDEDSDEDQDYYTDEFRPRVIRDDHENPSIKEIIRLVDRQKQRRQADENKLKSWAI